MVANRYEKRRMNVPTFKYGKTALGWVRNNSVEDDTSELVQAMEAEAAKYPTEPVVGVSINDEIVYVGPLEPPPRPDAVRE